MKYIRGYVVIASEYFVLIEDDIQNIMLDKEYNDKMGPINFYLYEGYVKIKSHNMNIKVYGYNKYNIKEIILCIKRQIKLTEEINSWYSWNVGNLTNLDIKSKKDDLR